MYRELRVLVRGESMFAAKSLGPTLFRSEHRSVVTDSFGKMVALPILMCREPFKRQFAVSTIAVRSSENTSLVEATTAFFWTRAHSPTSTYRVPSRLLLMASTIPVKLWVGTPLSIPPECISMDLFSIKAPLLRSMCRDQMVPTRSELIRQ